MGTKIKLLYRTTILQLMFFVFVIAKPVTITTDKGQLLGETVDTPFGKKVDAWNSIPFAKPPVGDLRFKHPVPNDAWEGVLDTTKIPNVCFQNVDQPIMKPFKKALYENKIVSEDCLYLSVYAPNPKPRKAAVMVWIHSSSNAIGGAHVSNLNYKMLAAYGDIVIVAIQYRLAAFGFLYDGSTNIPGNAGLYDQVMALEWIQKNIEHFGGDPKRVTLAGQASGANTAGMYIFSPKASPLFSQAILQSGSPNNVDGPISKGKSISIFKKIAKSVNCSVNEMYDENTVKCLRDISATDLASHTPFTTLQAIPDGELVLSDKKNMLNVKNDKQKTILIGSNKDEGTIATALLFPEKIGFTENTNLDSSDFMNVVTRLLNNTVKCKKLQKLAHYNYMSWDDPENSTRLRSDLVRLVSDYLYDCDIEYFVDWAAERNWNIYRYFFNYHADHTYFPKWFGSYNNLEVDYEFGGSYLYGSEAGKNMSRTIMEYISNFVKTGDPNIGDDGESSLPKWSIYTADKRGYLEMAGENTSFHENWKKNKNCILWRDYINADKKDYYYDLTKDIDPTTIEPNKILTVTKYIMTNMMNPSSVKLDKLGKKISMNVGFTKFTGLPKATESKTNTTTKFKQSENSWTMIQDSRTFTDIIE